ncbi:MAG: DsbA family protein [Gammaproteobacteria bacterium]|nr:DsbA family protein [Gammaproteobacteria bacterium]
MSKREQQRKIKEQKQREAQKRENTRKLATKIVLLGIFPLLVISAAYTLLNQGPIYSTVEIAENDHVRGTGNNPVNIVVYADFQCPACATEHQMMSQLWPSISDQSQLIFRHFPVTNTHPHAWSASLYAEAAGKQDKFWEMHDYLFATQPVWSRLSDVENEFDSYALELNLDIDQLKTDLNSEEVIAKVRNDLRGGSSAGVRATPAIFVNGRQLNNPNRSRILEAINNEIEMISN